MRKLLLGVIVLGLSGCTASHKRSEPGFAVPNALTHWARKRHDSKGWSVPRQNGKENVIVWLDRRPEKLGAKITVNQEIVKELSVSLARWHSTRTRQGEWILKLFACAPPSSSVIVSLTIDGNAKRFVARRAESGEFSTRLFPLPDRIDPIPLVPKGARQTSETVAGEFVVPFWAESGYATSDNGSWQVTWSSPIYD